MWDQSVPHLRPFYPVWMDVVFLILWLSDFHSTHFLTALSDGGSILAVTLMWCARRRVMSVCAAILCHSMFRSPSGVEVTWRDEWFRISLVP